MPRLRRSPDEDVDCGGPRVPRGVRHGESELIPAGLAKEWAQGLPLREVSTCERNAHLIAVLLARMPDDIRHHLLRQLRVQVAV